MEDISTQDLINGSEQAFKKLVETYKNQVMNTCYGFVHSYVHAEDLSQEVFIEVYESIRKFNGESKLSTWIYRIAVNKSLDFIRKSKRKKRWAELVRIGYGVKEESDNRFADYQSPDHTLEQKERIAILNKAIGTLPEKQRTAFTLHKYEDLSYSEVSGIMDTSVSSIESLIHRAKKNLQKRLTKYYLSEKW